MMLQITRSQNTAKVEQEIRRAVLAPGEHLRLPVHPKDWWLGGELGLVELTITWARQTDTSTLATYIRPDEDPARQLQSMSRRMFGLVALMMAHEIVDLKENPQRSLRSEAYKHCHEVIDMMFEPVAHFALGQKVFLLCADHTARWDIPWLYANPDTVKDLLGFNTLAQELVEKTAFHENAVPLPPGAIRDLGAILHELFENTHKFAKTDHNDVPWRRSVRGLSIERHSWSAPQRRQVASDTLSLMRYFDTVTETTHRANQRFLELTVFDSGIGLARRWLEKSWSRQLPLASEYEACMSCLTKNCTSSPSRGRGLGLAEVMAILNRLDGFLKLRTGRLSLYRDFASLPLRSPDDVELMDFASCSGTLTQLSPVFGTHYQMLIPVP